MQIASASTTVKFHEFPSGTVVNNYQPGAKIDGPIRSISWSRDGNWLAITPHTGQVEIVTIKDQLKLLRPIHAIEEPTCAAFHNTTKKNLAVGTKSGQLLVYDIKSRNIKKKFRTNSIVNQLEVLAKDGHIVAACANGEALLFSNVNNVLSGTYRVPKADSITAIKSCLIKKNYIAAGSTEGYVAVWDINKNKTKFFNSTHKAPITGITFSTINSDLLVSTGLDRQCCFYDIEANKCLASISVENSITSIDFSPNGQYIAMGSHDGKVSIYDSRKIMEPMHSFQAHNSSIKHLAFQKLDDNDESVYSMMEDSASSNKVRIEVDSARRNDSVGFLFVSEKEKSGSTSRMEDSFLAEIGLGSSSKYDNSFGGVTKYVSRDPNHEVTPNAPKIKEKLLSAENKHISSTPKYLTDEVAIIPISPIATEPATDSASDVNTIQKQTHKEEFKELLEEFRKDIPNTIKDIVKEELASLMAEWKQVDMMSHYETRRQVRQVHYNLQMYLVKESIKMEDFFNNWRSETGHSDEDSGLVEENIYLRRRIEELEAQLAETKQIN